MWMKEDKSFGTLIHCHYKVNKNIMEESTMMSIATAA